METEVGYKFEPIWVTALGFLSLYFVYEVATAFIADPSFDVPGFLFLSFPIVFCWVILPMCFKMLIGIPAIQFTPDQLIDNVVGVTINWDNIENLRISGTYKPFLSINLKDPKIFYSSIGNPVKRILVKITFSMATGDVPINLAFVAGNNERIADVAQVYWNKHHGITD